MEQGKKSTRLVKEVHCKGRKIQALLNFSASAGTLHIWLKVPSRKKAHMALSNIAQILSKKKKRAPGSVRPGLDTKQKNRENLDQIDIKQPKLRWACWQRQKQKSKYSRIQTKLLWNKVSMNNILRHFQEKKICTDFGYLLLEDTLFKTKPYMFLLLFKSFF